MVMENVDNRYRPNIEHTKRITDLSRAGIPAHLIAKIIGISEATLKKYYEHELSIATPEAIEAIAKTVYSQALNDGCTKSQALYLKTRGAKFGWVERQVIDNVQSQEELDTLKAKLKELEQKHEKDY